VASVLVDIIGLVLFSSHSRLLPESDFPGHSRTVKWNGRDSNLHGIFLHVLADFFTNCGVLVAIWLNETHGIVYAHGISSVVVSALILVCVYPLFMSTGLILLQTTPETIRSALEKCVRDISTYDGVLECRREHWWSQSPGVTVGTLHIRIRSDADDQAILVYVNNVLKKFLNHITIQIEKDEPVGWMIGGLS